MLLALVVIAALLVWIGVSVNNIVVNSAIIATETRNLRADVAELVEKVDALEGELDKLGILNGRVDDVAAIVAYAVAQRDSLSGLHGKPDYTLEKDMSETERDLLSRARLALKMIADS